MADPTPRSEVQIGTDAINAIIAQTRNLSDLSPLAPLSIMARGAWSPEIAGLYADQVRWAEGVYPHTATGAALDRVLANYGVARREAAAAYGPVVVTRLLEVEGAPAGTDAAAVVVPQGYSVAVVQADGQLITFTLRAAVTIPVGQQSAAGIVDAAAVGTLGNVGSRAISELTGGNVDGLKAITNEVAFTTGRDRDSDAQARQLFLDWLDARTRGTVAALRYAALSYVETGEDGVTRTPVLSASVREHLDAPGASGQAVTVYVMGHNGAFLTVAQKAGVQQRIDGYTDGGGQEVEGWRAAGIPVVVADPQLVGITIDVRLTLSTLGGPGTIERLRSALTALVAALPIGGALTLKAIHDEVCRLGSEVANATITAPPADILVEPDRKLVLDSLIVGEA